MSEHYLGSLNQMQKWVELGFPSKGSLSENQLKQLKEQLKKKEESSAAQHAALSKRNKKNELFKIDCKALSVWKSESERRERQRLKARTPQNFHNPTKILYPCLSKGIKESSGS